MLIVNKSSSIYWSYESLMKSNEALGLTFISVLRSISHSWDRDETIIVSKSFKGLIKEASEAFYHDIHGLSIEIDLINHIYTNKRDITRHKDFLYVSEILEKYLANLRSMYDYIAKVTKLAVPPKNHGQINFDSLNSLINSAKKGKLSKKIPDSLEKELLEIEESFQVLREVRDKIIHNGKQFTVGTDDMGYFIQDFTDKEGAFTPLLPLLSKMTTDLLLFSENIADIIFEEYPRNYREFTFFWTALEGVCIPSFIEFLGLRQS